MATLQASLRRSSFNLPSSYKPSLITIIKPSRPVQRRFSKRLQGSTFTTSSSAQKEAQRTSNDQDRSNLDPNSTKSTNSNTHAEVSSQLISFNPSSTAPESELEEARQEAAEDSSGDADSNAKDAGSKENTRANNPLEVSPANRDVSASKDEGGAKGQSKVPSKRGSPAKGKQV
ncbi:hypothetical protein EMCG_01178 [[Emmonsia] crescens]|uniref:Uncharacterized protein n=1 Tax=[Emmonsia] crescens TaxID=73230 RepID=A0A0G2I5S5_9EURO|nr:hypothetical protein EMCG_01178 [Emmonsia crescens UAMH 3008]